MKLAARQLVSPNGSHAKIDLIAVAGKLNMLSHPNVTMRGQQCETA
jgi:hypothetical protein